MPPSTARRQFNKLLGICLVGYLVYVLVHFLGGHPRAVKIHALAGLATAILWSLGLARPRLIPLASQLNLAVATLTLGGHAWNGAMQNDSAWFLTLVPLLAAYQMGSKAALQWTLVVTAVLVFLPIMANRFHPEPEWILTQGEVDRNRVLLVLLMSALGIASARSTKEEMNRANRLNENLERSNKDLENLSNILCHDLKAPLRGVKGCVQVLEQSLPDLKSEDREIFEHILNSAGRMSELIDALNEYSKATTISTARDDIDLDQLLVEVSRDLSADVRSRKAVLKIGEKLGRVTGYAPLLRQLFQNLISNALKFQPEGQVPIVEVGRLPDGSFYVKDNGIGMDPSCQERVFLLYDRAGLGREFEGSGIGLAICSRVVNSHGGKIRVESQPGQGARFLFTLESA